MLEMVIQIGTIIIATYIIANYLITINLEDRIKSKLEIKETVNLNTVLSLVLYFGLVFIMYTIISIDWSAPD